MVLPKNALIYEEGRNNNRLYNFENYLLCSKYIFVRKWVMSILTKNMYFFKNKKSTEFNFYLFLTMNDVKLLMLFSIADNFEVKDETNILYHIEQNPDNHTSRSANKILDESNKIKNVKSQETDKENLSLSQHISEAHKFNQQNNKQQQQLQHLTNNAIDNCFTSDVTSTIVNIDIFDDQLSMSTNSNTSRFSCEAGPISTTTPPISLNGVIDTNLMHFSPNTTQTHYPERLECGCPRLSEDLSTIEHKCDNLSSAIDNGRSGHENSSNEGGGSL